MKMKTPGITVRPIATLDGEQEINEVFVDGVKVPVENMVGDEPRPVDLPEVPDLERAFRARARGHIKGTHSSAEARRL
jgi:alkylation response protein AidB-like acyl-CoA dehydrogenase